MRDNKVIKVWKNRNLLKKKKNNNTFPEIWEFLLNEENFQIEMFGVFWLLLCYCCCYSTNWMKTSEKILIKSFWLFVVFSNHILILTFSFSLCFIYLMFEDYEFYFHFEQVNSAHFIKTNNLFCVLLIEFIG